MNRGAPARDAAGLRLGKVRLHREVRPRQVESGLEVFGGGHGRKTWQRSTPAKKPSIHGARVVWTPERGGVRVESLPGCGEPWKERDDAAKRLPVVARAAGPAVDGLRQGPGMRSLLLRRRLQAGLHL